MELELKESPGHRTNGQAPVLPPPAPTGGFTSDERSILQGFISEIDVYYMAVKGFSEQDTDSVMQQISAYSARLIEIRGRLQRMGSTRATQLRTRELDPLLEHLEFQFKIASRRLTDREAEFKMSGGGV